MIRFYIVLVFTCLLIGCEKRVVVEIQQPQNNNKAQDSQSEITVVHQAPKETTELYSEAHKLIKDIRDLLNAPAERAAELNKIKENIQLRKAFYSTFDSFCGSLHKIKIPNNNIDNKFSYNVPKTENICADLTGLVGDRFSVEMEVVEIANPTDYRLSNRIVSAINDPDKTANKNLQYDIEWKNKNDESKQCYSFVLDSEGVTIHKNYYGLDTECDINNLRYLAFRFIARDECNIREGDDDNIRRSEWFTLWEPVFVSDGKNEFSSIKIEMKNENNALKIENIPFPNVLVGLGYDVEKDPATYFASAGTSFHFEYIIPSCMESVIKGDNVIDFYPRG